MAHLFNVMSVDLPRCLNTQLTYLYEVKLFRDT